MQRHHALFTILVLSVPATSLIACGGHGDDCAVGSEACACTPGAGCDPGLLCLSQTCVRPPAAVEATSPTADGATADAAGADAPMPDAGAGIADGATIGQPAPPGADAPVSPVPSADAATVTIDADHPDAASKPDASPPNVEPPGWGLENGRAVCAGAPETSQRGGCPVPRGTHACIRMESFYVAYGLKPSDGQQPPARPYLNAFIGSDGSITALDGNSCELMTPKPADKICDGVIGDTIKCGSCELKVHSHELAGNEAYVGIDATRCSQYATTYSKYWSPSKGWYNASDIGKGDCNGTAEGSYRCSGALTVEVCRSGAWTSQTSCDCSVSVGDPRKPPYPTNCKTIIGVANAAQCSYAGVACKECRPGAGCRNL